MTNDPTTPSPSAPVAQTSESAVSQVSQPANAATIRARRNFSHPAGLETCATTRWLAPVIRHSSFVIFLLLVGCASRFTPESTHLVLTHAGQPLARFVFKDDKILRPYFAHVRTLDGIPVTRNHPPVPGVDAVDHPTMHPGLWLAFGDLVGHDFWRNKAVIRHERFTTTPRTRDTVTTFATRSSLVASNGATVGSMDSHFALRVLDDGWLLSWTATMTPSVDNFCFGDQEEMGFGVRVATPLAERNGGTILTSEGARGAKASWGQTAAWSDCSGVNSNRTVGVTLFAAPENFRPSWFHNRDYGLMVANPFGRKAFTKGDPSRVEVPRGKSFTLRGGWFVHSTPVGTTPDLDSAYRQFIPKP